MNANTAVALTRQFFPSGSTYGRLRFKLKQNAVVMGTQYATPPDGSTSTSVVFPSVSPGTGYTVEGQLLNSADQPLSNSVSSVPFDVVAPAQVAFDVPVSITVTVA